MLRRAHAVGIVLTRHGGPFASVGWATGVVPARPRSALSGMWIIPGRASSAERGDARDRVGVRIRLERRRTRRMPAPRSSDCRPAAPASYAGRRCARSPPGRSPPARCCSASRSRRSPACGRSAASCCSSAGSACGSALAGAARPAARACARGRVPRRLRARPPARPRDRRVAGGAVLVAAIVGAVAWRVADAPHAAPGRSLLATRRTNLGHACNDTRPPRCDTRMHEHGTATADRRLRGRRLLDGGGEPAARRLRAVARPGASGRRSASCRPPPGDADHYVVRFYRTFAGALRGRHVSLFRRDRGDGAVEGDLAGAPARAGRRSTSAAAASSRCSARGARTGSTACCGRRGGAASCCAGCRPARCAGSPRR